MNKEKILSRINQLIYLSCTNLHQDTLSIVFPEKKDEYLSGYADGQKMALMDICNRIKIGEFDE